MLYIWYWQYYLNYLNYLKLCIGNSTVEVLKHKMIYVDHNDKRKFIDFTQCNAQICSRSTASFNPKAHHARKAVQISKLNCHRI